MTRLIALLELVILAGVLAFAVGATAARGVGQVCPRNHPHCRPFPCHDAAGQHCGPQ